MPVSIVPDAESELEWLQESTGDEVMGFDAVGWEDTTWILHTMHELSPEQKEPDDWADTPRDAPPSWHRVTWREFAARRGIRLGAGQDAPPFYRWLGWDDMDHEECERMVGPMGGSLAPAEVRALCQVLASHSPSGPSAACFAFYAQITTADVDRLILYEGAVADLSELLLRQTHQNLLTGPWPVGSPTNVWPVDRSWFTLTDWDLPATKVSGSTAVVDALRAHPELETFDWRPGTH